MSSKIFLKKFINAAIGILIITSLSSSSIYLGYDTGAENLTYAAYFDESILVDQDGYLVKSIPQTEVASDRSDMKDKLHYKVKSGESLSDIAQKFGVKISTVVWENNLANPDTIKPGEELVIPPVDGVSHTVAKGESIAKISETYSVDSNLIASQNEIQEGNSIKEGQVLFIPGGKKIVVETNDKIVAFRPTETNKVASTSSGSRGSVSTGKGKSPATSSVTDLGGGSSTNNAPAGGKPFIKPTKGILTQGYKSGHLAVDLADRSRPDVWAAAAGTVTKSQCDSSGYGCHIYVNHGNGLQSHYAHCQKLYVGVGAEVSQGQAICQMGNTGRVYGVTGIHLHFEVIVNGAKANPLNYY